MYMNEVYKLFVSRLEDIERSISLIEGYIGVGWRKPFRTITEVADYISSVTEISEHVMTVATILCKEEHEETTKVLGKCKDLTERLRDICRVAYIIGGSGEDLSITVSRDFQGALDRYAEKVDEGYVLNRYPEEVKVSVDSNLRNLTVLPDGVMDEGI